MNNRKQLLQYIDRYSKLAMKWVLLLLVAIVIIQTLLQLNSVRKIIVPTERWEGHKTH